MIKILNKECYEYHKESLENHEEIKSRSVFQMTEQRAKEIRESLLEYRREHNIFDIGDKVIVISNAYVEYDCVLTIDFISRFDLMLSDKNKGFEINAICGWGKIIRHATPEEIQAGRRL